MRDWPGTAGLGIRDQPPMADSHTGDKITAGGKQVFPGGCCLCTSINCDGSDSRNHAFTFWGEWGDFSSPTEERAIFMAAFVTKNANM